MLNDLDEASIERAKQLVLDKSVTVGLAETDHKLYVKAIIECKDGTVTLTDLMERTVTIESSISARSRYSFPNIISIVSSQQFFGVAS